MTTHEIDHLVDSSQPQRGWLRGSNLVLLILAMIIGASLASSQLLENNAWWYGTQIAMLLAVIVVLRETWRQRRMGRWMLEAFESVQLQDWKRAEGALRQLLSHPVRPASSRVEALLALASVSEAHDNYEASQHIYEAILGEESADPIQQHTTHLALAAAMLRNGQTTDAVALIDKLERIHLPEPMEAQVSLLSLFREVVMGHAHETLEQAPRRRALFRRNLSTRAAFGYALLAAAFDRASESELATQYWHDATLLVHPDQLTDRFELLKPIASKYPAATRPLPKENEKPL